MPSIHSLLTHCYWSDYIEEKKPEEREDAQITETDVLDVFRCNDIGTFDQATREKWFVLMTKFVPMCSEGSKAFSKRGVQTTTTADQSTMISNEAFVYWTFLMEEDDWYKRIGKYCGVVWNCILVNVVMSNITNTCPVSSVKPSLKLTRRKEKGKKHMSNARCQEYYTLYQNIQNLRKSDKSWDRALKLWSIEESQKAPNQNQATTGSAGMQAVQGEEESVTNLHSVVYCSLGAEDSSDKEISELESGMIGEVGERPLLDKK